MKDAVEASLQAKSSAQASPKEPSAETTLGRANVSTLTQPAPAILNLPAAKVVPQTASVVLGRDTPFLIKMESQKQWYQEPALYVSIVAIAFSIFSLWKNLRVGFTKDRRARRQSIQDEFWLRKVLYPLAIEPALEYYAKMLSSLPADRFDSSATAQAVEEFKKEFEHENSAIVAKIVTLGILGTPLLDAVRVELEGIEDIVSEYCFENSLGYNPISETTTNTRSSVENLVSGRLVTIMQAIKALQEAIE